MPSFQRKLPIASVAILGLLEFLSGIVVLTLELLIFDIGLGLWCGVIYALAGAAILVLGLPFDDYSFSRNEHFTYILVIGTDRERHQTSAVLIFQLVGKDKAIVISLSISFLTLQQ